MKKMKKKVNLYVEKDFLENVLEASMLEKM